MGIEIRQSATCMVIQSASDVVHWPLVDNERMRTAAKELEWIDFTFVDESQLGEVKHALEDAQLCALIVTSNALAVKSVRDFLEIEENLIRDSVETGMGLLISVGILTDVSEFPINFLSEPLRCRITPLDVPTEPLTGDLVVDGVTKSAIGERNIRARIWTQCSASELAHWRPWAWQSGADGQTVAWIAEAGAGTAVVSVLPFERVGDNSALTQTLRRVTARRAFAIVGGPSIPDWYLSVAKGSCLIRIDPAATPPPNWLDSSFAHLRVGSPVDKISENQLQRDALLARLERGGSLSIVTIDPIGSELALTLDCPPEYLRILRKCEPLVLSSIGQLAGGPTFQTLAYALLAATAGRVVRGDSLLPGAFRHETISAIVRNSLNRRVKNGHVDDLLLPTFNLYVAATLHGINDESLDEIRNWLKTEVDTAEAEQIWQCRWLAHISGSELLSTLPVPTIAPVSVIGQLAKGIDTGSATETATSLLTEARPLDKALLAFTIAWMNLEIPSTLLPLSPDTERQGSTEELLVRMATLALRSSNETAHFSTSDGRQDSFGVQGPRETTPEMVKAASVVSYDLELRMLRVRHNELTQITSQLIAVIGVVLLVLAAGLGVFIGSSQILLEIKIPLIATLISVTTFLLAKIGSSKALAPVLPKWLRRLSRLVHK